MENHADREEVSEALQTGNGSAVPIQSVRQLVYEILYNLCDNAVNITKTAAQLQ